MGNNLLLQEAGLVCVIAVCPYDGTGVTLELDTWSTIYRVATVAVTFYCGLISKIKYSTLLLFRITWRCCINLEKNLSLIMHTYTVIGREVIAYYLSYYKSRFWTKLKIVMSHVFKFKWEHIQYLSCSIKVFISLHLT